jgi:hypothetical protein
MLGSEEDTVVLNELEEVVSEPPEYLFPTYSVEAYDDRP